MKKLTIENVDNLLQLNTVRKFFKNNNDVLKVTKQNNGKLNIDKSVIDTMLNKSKPAERPNLYGIFTKETGRDWELQYIGLSKSGLVKERLKNHLIKKNKATGAKLDNIKKALKNKQQIGIKFMQVKPEELRHYYEEKLIKALKPEWNIHK